MPPSNSADWEQDEHMQHLLKRKNRLEELEEYNSSDAMLRKRRAVREEAWRTPAPSMSTDLDFDDDIEASEHAEQAPQDHDDEEQAERWARKSKRGKRRARCAMRRRALKLKAQQQQVEAVR